jgi:heme-degrading monooxygenase HmoA
MSDNPEAINKAPELSAEVVEQLPKPYGKRNPNAYIEQRQQRLYRRQLDGLSARQLVLEHAERESVSVATAWRDWEAVNKWNSEDWERDRQNMLARLQTMRTKLFNAAIRKGQLQTAAQVLDSLGRVINEGGVEQQAAAAPTLNITVEDRRQPG